MTYGQAPLERIDLRTLQLLEACPSARGPGSALPAAGLERWKALRGASVEWHQSGMPEDGESVERITDAFFASWDPVQRRILDRLFAAYRRLFPSDADGIDLDPPPGGAVHDQTNRSITVGVQVEIETTAGPQAIRIKTGRGGTTPEEAAAFYHSDERRTLVDLRLAEDDLVAIPAPADPARIVDDVALRWDRAQSAPKTGRTAGLHCHGCARPARCGQYPVVGDGPVTRQTRTLVLSKSRLADVDRCLRSAAWPVVYGIPKDDGEDDELDSMHRMVGNHFHEAVAAALLSDDPGRLYEAATRMVAPSEVEDLRWLFDQHEALWAADDPQVRVAKTEYQFGATFVVEGTMLDRRDHPVAAPVAVTMTAVTDVNGWESDRVAAVVEHRTGSSSSALPHEADLYAVAAWHALAAIGREVDGVAVHFHHLRGDPAWCERLFYDGARVKKAASSLADVASAISALHPGDATAAPFSVGPWCDWCDRLETCKPHRS